jgi:hypothetical protein
MINWPALHSYCSRLLNSWAASGAGFSSMVYEHQCKKAD